MHIGARTPEELETLLEDAFVMRDHRAVAALFEPDAVLGGGETAPAYGRPMIVQATQVMWAREQIYLGAPTHVLQIRGTALITGRFATSVAHRTRGGAWRYAITLLHGQPQTERSTT